MFNIFTYGSLMFDEVWSRVIVGGYDKSTSTLKGFTRKAVIKEEYPVIFKTGQTDTVEGVIYYNVSIEDVRRLDAFEGEYYDRQHVKAQTLKADTIDVHVYVLKDAYRHIASQEDWDPEYFKEKGMNYFISEYSGFYK